MPRTTMRACAPPAPGDTSTLDLLGHLVDHWMRITYVEHELFALDLSPVPYAE